MLGRTKEKKAQPTRELIYTIEEEDDGDSFIQIYDHGDFVVISIGDGANATCNAMDKRSIQGLIDALEGALLL